jgi:hypothetical protein
MRQWGERWETGVPSNPILCDEHDRQPILPVVLRSHDNRILSHADLCWIDSAELEQHLNVNDSSANIRKIGST